MITLTVRAEEVVVLGAVLVREAVGREEDAVLDGVMYFRFSDHDAAEDARAAVAKLRGMTATLTHDENPCRDIQGRGLMPDFPGSGRVIARPWVLIVRSASARVPLAIASIRAVLNRTEDRIEPDGDVRFSYRYRSEAEAAKRRLRVVEIRRMGVDCEIVGPARETFRLQSAIAGVMFAFDPAGVADGAQPDEYLMYADDIAMCTTILELRGVLGRMDFGDNPAMTDRLAALLGVRRTRADGLPPKPEPPGQGGYINKHGVRVPNPCGEIDMKGRDLDKIGRHIRPEDRWDEATLDRLNAIVESDAP